MLAKHVHPKFSLTDTGQTPNSVHTYWPLTHIALVGGFAGQGLLKPARVKFYNVLHSPRFAAVLVAAGLLVVLGGGPRLVLLSGATWLLHIAVDRACGYGLREPDGSIRPIGRASTSDRSPAAAVLCSR